MKKIAISILSLTLILTSCSKENESSNPVSDSGSNKIKDQYIVIFKENSSLKINPSLSYEAKQEEVSRFAKTIFNDLKITKYAVLKSYAVATKGVALTISANDAAQLKNNENVLLVEQDQVISLSPFTAMGKPGGGGTTQPAQTTPWGITRVGGAIDGTGKTAWIIDSGVDLTHPDLNVNTAKSKSFLTGSASATSPNDENGHGTHVAGTIAAKNNTIGVVGVSPNAAVVAVRVLDRRGSGTTSGVIAGVDYVAQNGQPGDVANMSLGGGVSTALDNAVINAAATGVLFVLAAGNETDNANNHSPARVNAPNVYTISATDVNDIFASFSNFGAGVDFAAPGVSIKSTWKGGAYNTISGTSMATPHVAGLLLTSSVINSGGFAINDPDGNPDVIAHR